jgi:hypothetical protein
MAPNAPRTEKFSAKFDGSDVPSEAKMVIYLSLLAAGLDTPRARKATERRRGYAV